MKDSEVLSSYAAVWFYVMVLFDALLWVVVPWCYLYCCCCSCYCFCLYCYSSCSYSCFFFPKSMGFLIISKCFSHNKTSFITMD